jgi:transcriptional regulator GlxA family with amidase domain
VPLKTLMTRSVGILVFENVEVLDFAGPYEVFTTASRMHARADPAAPALFRVFTVGRSLAPLRARAGLSVFPDFDFSNHPTIDVLVIPGGVVTEELARSDVAEWIARCSARNEITASVCTGAFLLAQAGLLTGLSVTTHWEDVADLRSMFPGLTVLTNQRWVDQGRIVTSAGISAGIDMSLHVVERVAGRALAERTARQMDFDWTENA